MNTATVNMTFERYEKKYIIPADKFSRLKTAIENHMIQDEYGLHTINTIYFDTDDYQIIRHSLSKPKFKEKLRLRCYGKATKYSTVYLELKKKYEGITYKRRVPLTLEEGKAYFKENKIPQLKNKQVLDEVDWFIKQFAPEPKVFISYDRLAYYGMEDETFRVTFDANIRWRDYQIDFLKGDYGNHLLEPGVRLMEVKTMKAMPIWFCNILSELAIYPESFSKYGNIYTKYLMDRKEEVVCIAG